MTASASAPRVSVVIAAYNQAEYLGQALRALLAQTFTDWEAIVVDDGSTDDTGAVAAAFADGRLRYVRQENQERSRTRNNGIRLARGGYIALLDADDYWLPGYLSKQVAYLDLNAAVGLSYAWAYNVDPAGTILGLVGRAGAGLSVAEFQQAMVFGNRIGTPSAVVARAECLRAAGLFDPELRYGEDWDLWLRLGAQSEIGCVPEPLVCYRRYHIRVPDRFTRRGLDPGHVRIVQAALARLPESARAQVQAEALGRAYWYTAWMRYAVGEIEAGQARLAQAREANPALWQPPYREFVESAAYFADELYDLATPPAEALACLDRLFDNLPAWAAPLRGLRRAAKGRYYGLCLFRSYERGDWAGVRWAAARALFNQPGWLANRGFLSILAQALGLRRRASAQPPAVSGRPA